MNPFPDPLEILARELEIDWIKSNNYHFFRELNPDYIEWNSSKPQEFWCPEFRWSINGKIFKMVVPVKTKELKISAKKFLGFTIIPECSYHIMDEKYVINYLINSIIKTKNDIDNKK